MYDGHRRIRRCREESRDIGFASESHVHRTVGVIIWVITAFGSRSALVYIRGSMTNERNVDDVFQPMP